MSEQARPKVTYTLPVMDREQMNWPARCGVRFVTHEDDAIAELDARKLKIFKTVGQQLSDEQIEANENEIDKICQQQAPLSRQAQELRGKFIILSEWGLYWAALQELNAALAARLEAQLKPTVEAKKRALEARSVQ